MKKMLLGSLFAALLAGCASQPTSVERKFFDIETNLVGRVMVVTNVVPVFVTNSVVSTATNWESGAPVAVSMTNATVSEYWETNRAVATNLEEAYTFTPNTNAAAVSNVVARSAGLLGPFADLAFVLSGAAFGLWGYLRSARASKVAGVLAQVIETGRMVLQTTPQGQQLDEQWKLWMLKHQAEHGVLMDVVQLLGNVVDNESARAAAEKLLQRLRVETELKQELPAPGGLS